MPPGLTGLTGIGSPTRISKGSPIPLPRLSYCLGAVDGGEAGVGTVVVTGLGTVVVTGLGTVVAGIVVAGIVVAGTVVAVDLPPLVSFVGFDRAGDLVPGGFLNAGYRSTPPGINSGVGLALKSGVTGIDVGLFAPETLLLNGVPGLF